MSDLLERLIGAFRSTPVEDKERLEWHARYAHRDPIRDGADLYHTAKSKAGVFEIFESGSHGETVFLLTFPRSMGLPSELFNDMERAKDRARKAHEATHD